MRMLFRLRYRLVLLSLAIVVALSPACALRSGGAMPQATIAHYGTNVLEAVQAAQQGVIAMNANQLLSDDVTRTVLNGIRDANGVAEKLSVALKVYDAALPGIAQAVALRDISAIVTQFNMAISAAFNIELPTALVAEIQGLIANVNKTILEIQLELAKGRA